MTGETKHSESKDYKGAVCPRCHLKSEVSITLNCSHVQPITNQYKSKTVEKYLSL